MATLHLENTVHDFDEWKAAFDKFEQFRVNGGVRAYRVSRSVTDPTRVTVDLDFESAEEANVFRTALEKVWQSPQSKAALVSHATPELYDVVVDRQLVRAR